MQSGHGPEAIARDPSEGVPISVPATGDTGARVTGARDQLGSGAETNAGILPAGEGGTAATVPVIGAVMRVVDIAVDAVLGLALVSEFLVMFISSSMREINGNSLHSALDLAELSLSTITFLGGAVAYRRGYHISVQALVGRLPAGVRTGVRVGTETAVIVLCAAAIQGLFPLLRAESHQRMAVLGVSRLYLYLPVLIGFLLIAMYALMRVLALGWGRHLIGAVVPIAAALYVEAFKTSVNFNLFSSSTTGLTVICVIFGVLIALGLPLAFAMMACSMLYLIAQDGVIPLQSFPTQMQDGIGSNLLLAIPFFMLAGILMTVGGISHRLADLAAMFLNRLRGGPLHVTIVSVFLFSGISGSKTADIASVGAALNDVNERNGYPPEETAAVLSASAAMGETIPPSTVVLVWASISTVSISSLFVAGVLPAVVLAVLLMIVVFLRSKKMVGSRPAVERPGAGRPFGRIKVGLAAIPALSVPLVLVGGIIGGVATPTEVSSWAVFLGLIFSTVIYRGLSFTGFLAAMRDTVNMAGMILFIIGAATAFAFTLSILNAPQETAKAIGHLGHHPVLFLAVAALALLVFGAIMEGLPALVIMGPLLLPAATAAGIDPVQFSVVLIVAMGIGAFSPPIGVGIYTACIITKTSLDQVSKRFMPYLLVLLLGLALLIAVPAISLIFI